ncbi:TIGR01906 family membrane protein [Hespellia stercorisuis]|uniref:Integral membrane protein TIGR01906 n=1 Tax=Hespellia stercorisuis DSM 15480 TaxID=1121950 RepID=A0A1M6PG83_9FIRM|nr:TIGR01906 family membrane protein [Hespellia stercorisuis]SHK06902.1 integral membrane protein TIGR01906 [Hespellia stercorisuis DSM 15480]
MREKIQGILAVIASLMCIVALLITSFEAAIYGNYDYYEKEYKKYDVMSELNMDIEDVMDVTHVMMAYLRGDRKDMVVYTEIDGEKGVEFFNTQDKMHFYDVKNLFLGGLKLRRSCLLILAFLLVILLLSKTDWKFVFPRAFLAGLGLALAATIVLGVIFAIDFTAAFTKFHEMFFTNDLWVFDPATDYMIRMLPEGFFSDMVIRIGSIFIGSILLLTGGSVYMVRKTRRCEE